MGAFNLDKIVDGIVSAGDYALENQGSSIVQMKEIVPGPSGTVDPLKGPYSEIDIHTQLIIMDYLLDTQQSLGVMVEERNTRIVKALKHFNHVNHFQIGKYTILIDPIDGSSNYLGLNGEEKKNFWGVSVAVAYGNEIIAGAVYFPALNGGMILKTEKKSGAFLSDQKLSLSQGSLYSSNDLVKVSSIIGEKGDEIYRHFSNSELRAPQSYVVTILGLMKGGSENSITSLSSIHNLLGFKAYIGMNTNILDIGPCTLAYEEAGGLITDIYGNTMNLNDCLSKNSSDGSYTVNKPYILTPNRGYFASLKRHLKSNQIDLEKLEKNG